MPPVSLVASPWGLECQTQPFNSLPLQGRVSRSDSRYFSCCCRPPPSCQRTPGRPRQVGGLFPAPEEPRSCVPGSAPHAPPLPSRPPSFPFRLAVPGRGEGAVSRWDGGFLQTPRGVAWARSPRGSFCRERADWDLGRLWEKGPRLSRPPHLFWDPSGPQQSSLFSLRAPFGGSRRRQGKAGWRVLFLQPLTFQAPSGFSAPVETICPDEDPGCTRHSGESGGGNTLTGLSCFLWRLNLHLGGPHCPDELREAQVGAIAASSSPRTLWTQGWNFLGVLQGLSAESSLPSSLPANGLQFLHPKDDGES